MTSYCEEQYIHSLEKKIKEQEAMIDWLADMCKAFCDAHSYCNECTLHPVDCPIKTQIEFRFNKYEVPDWRKVAQEAVKKNES